MRSKNFIPLSVLSACLVFVIMALGITLASCDTGAGAAPAFNVTFSQGEGGGMPPNRIPMNPDGYARLPEQGAMTHPTGKKLSGWKAPDDSLIYNPLMEYKVTRDVMFTAQWRDANAALSTVTFAGGGGGGVLPAAIQAAPGNVISLPTQGNMSPPVGKEFDGWLVNGVHYQARAQYIVSSSSITITAQWKDVGSATPTDPTNPTNPSTPSRPSAPTGLSASISSGAHISLSWNAVSGATSYKVYGIHADYEYDVKINGASASGTFYEWTGEEGWQYTFWVTAVNSAGEGPASSRVKLTIPDSHSTTPSTPDTPSTPSVSVPGQVTGLTVTDRSVDGYSMIWDAVPGATSYNIYYSWGADDSAGQFWGSTSSTNAFVPSHPDGGCYFKVTAVNSAGEGPASAIES